MKRLPDVEGQAVERHRHPVLEGQRGDHVPVRADGVLRDDPGGDADGHVRSLLPPDRPGGRSRPLAPPGRQPSQRIDVQDDQQHRQGHDDGLGHRGENEARHRARQPAAPARPVRADRLQVGEDRQQEPEPGEHVAPLGRPRDRLHPQRMDREEQRGGERPEPEHALARARRDAQQPQGHEVEGDRGGGVEQDVRQVIAERVHAPEPIVDPEGDPGDRDPVARERGGEHPAQVLPAEPPEIRVVDEIHGVVPVHELVPEGRPEHRDRDQRAGERAEPPPPPRIRRGGRDGVGRSRSGRGRDPRSGAPRRPRSGAHRSGSDTIGGTRRVWVMKRDESG